VESTIPEALWEQACQGREEEAYRSLLALHERRPGAEEICLQLYWLLVALPALDPKRSACDWLVEGLLANEWSGALRTLYRREVTDDPSEALSDRCARLLHRGRRPGLVLDLVEIRWRSSRALGRWEVITGDVESLRAAGLDADAATWGRLLLAAATQLVWGDAVRRESARQLGREIESLHLLDSGLDDDLTRLDFQWNVAVCIATLTKKKESGIPATLARLIPDTWDVQAAELRVLLMPLLADVARNPRRSLRAFDRIRAGAPAVLGHLANLLDDLGRESGIHTDHRSPAELSRLACSVLSGMRWAIMPTEIPVRYWAFRSRLLTYCLNEAINPESLARALAPLPEFAITPDRHLAHELEADWSLRIVCAACAVFRA
jgi:hypothetical protein